MPRDPDRELESEYARTLRRVEAEAERLLPKIEAEAAKIAAKIEAEASAGMWPEKEADSNAHRPAPQSRAGTPAGSDGPSWMSAEDWQDRVAAYRRQGRSTADIAEVAAHLERRGPRPPRPTTPGRQVPREPGGQVTGGGHAGGVIREDYLPKEREARYLTRDADGLPTLRLVNAGNRLAIWSPVDGGALINPKGPGLRRLGLYASSARGSDYHAAAYRAADLRMGRWVDLVREPGNVHDANAVMMCAPGRRVPVGYVQRGRAAAVARRMDAGEDMAAVSMRGPGPGHGDGAAFVLIGNRADLRAALSK